jgi:hypothetical protein
VGAYNVTQSMPFIHYRPAVVLIGEQGEVDVIREGEDLSDITRREKLPKRLERHAAGDVRKEAKRSETQKVRRSETATHRRHPHDGTP